MVLQLSTAYLYIVEELCWNIFPEQSMKKLEFQALLQLLFVHFIFQHQKDGGWKLRVFLGMNLSKWTQEEQRELKEKFCTKKECFKHGKIVLHPL